MGCGCEPNCEHNNQKRPKQRVNQTSHFGNKPNRSKGMQLDSKTFAIFFCSTSKGSLVREFSVAYVAILSKVSYSTKHKKTLQQFC